MRIIIFTTLLVVVGLFGLVYVANAQTGNGNSDIELNSNNAKEELRNLIDAYAYLGDEKKISEQMGLFTPDATYKVYMNGVLAVNVSGTETLEKEFSGHASQVKTYFTMNGQQTLRIDGDTATGVSYSQIKMIRESEGKNTITDYSVKYDDKYVYQNKKWLIKERVCYFIIVEARPLSNLNN